MCLGKGIVCPSCLGYRFQRVPDTYGAKLARCTGCCEGNQIHPDRELATIRTYLASPDYGEWAWRADLAAQQAAYEAASRDLAQAAARARILARAKGARP